MRTMVEADDSRPGAPIVLTEADHATYRRDGFLILRRVIAPDEIARLAADCDVLARRDDILQPENMRCRFQPHIESGENLLEAVDGIIDLCPAVERIARDLRLLGPLGELFGAPAHLFKDKLVYKPPGSNGYALHQDYIPWPDFPRTFTSVVVAIDAGTAENGCIELYRGYHQRGYLSPRDGDYHDLPDHLFERATLARLELAPGDVGIFGCFAPHRSPPNRSAHGRRHLYLSYNSARDGGDQRAQHYATFHRWLRERYAEYGVTNLFFR